MKYTGQRSFTNIGLSTNWQATSSADMLALQVAARQQLFFVDRYAIFDQAVTGR
jgi:hypothetical protein